MDVASNCWKYWIKASTINWRVKQPTFFGGVLKTTQVSYSAILEVRSLMWVSLRWYQGIGRAVFFSGHAEGESISSPFQLLEAACLSWFMAPSIFQINNVSWVLPRYLISSSLLPPFPCCPFLNWATPIPLAGLAICGREGDSNI